MSDEYKTYFETFCKAKMIKELKEILKIARNPLDRKKLSTDEKKEIRTLIKTMGIQ